MNDRVRFTLWIVVPLLYLAGCTTMGTGYGSTAGGGNPVRFDWKSSDDVSGSMSAKLADGSLYTGPYFQITSTTTVDTLGPQWTGWGPTWGYGSEYGWGGGWGYGGETLDAGTESATHYTGRVVADLADSGGKHIRCKFHLVHPSDGMAGGGLGACQLPDHKTIVTSFPGAS
jgi:hypothetical protein